MLGQQFLHRLIASPSSLYWLLSVSIQMYRCISSHHFLQLNKSSTSCLPLDTDLLLSSSLQSLSSVTVLQLPLTAQPTLIYILFSLQKFSVKSLMVLTLLVVLATLNPPFQTTLPLTDAISCFPSTSLATHSYLQVSSPLTVDSQSFVPKALFSSFCTFLSLSRPFPRPAIDSCT